MRYEIINTKKRELGLTNAQLAEKSGVTLSTLDKITSGVNQNPKLSTLKAIARVIGCTLNDFDDEYANRFSDVSAAYASASPDVRRCVRALLSMPQTPHKEASGISAVTLMILFESADVSVKNQVVSLLVDHSNQKLSESPFAEASSQTLNLLQADE